MGGWGGEKSKTHGVDAARGILLEDGLDDLVHLGHAGHAPDEENLVKVLSFFFQEKKPR